jgi:transposase
MKKYIRIGVDLGKGYFQVHALENEAGAAVNRKISRGKLLAFFSGISPCRVGMEACGSSNYWAREIAALGHEVVLIAPAYIKPYVKRGKNDAVDAEAICEAMSRPSMRFVPVKSAEQQAALMLHKDRELLVKQRTMSVNALRGHLAEFGIVVAKGIQHVDHLLELARKDAALPEMAKQAVERMASRLNDLDQAIAATEKAIAAASAKHANSRLPDQVPGIGPLIASVIAASMPDPSAFRSGRDFSAWLGLTPSQNSSGGKQKLGPITKKGNRYIRKLLVVGSTSLLRVAHKRKGALADWINALAAKKLQKVAAVALANKLARICWAILSTGECFREETYAKA